MNRYEKICEMWKSYNINTSSGLDKYLDNFRILFAYHSGKIENDEITYWDTREIFENGRVSNYTGNPRALFEQQNQKLCYDMLRESIVCKEPLSMELIKETHKILLSGTYDGRRYIENKERPGEFKKHDYVTGINEVGYPADTVESGLEDLLAEMNGYRGNDIIKAAAYFHAVFEYIHPFADGNGRVGRTLTNYFLMTREHPPLIVFDEDKKDYYECLRLYDENEEVEPLCKFFMSQTEKTWEKVLANAEGTKPERRFNKLTFGINDGRKHMKLISWNVNGLRSCVGKGFLDFFNESDADIFCVQETKMMKEQADFEIPQRFDYWHSANKKGYSGTAVFSKAEPLSCSFGMGIEEHDQEGRIITLEYEKFILVNVYTPNSKRELLRLDYRMVWEDAFRAFLHGLEKNKPVIVCGDLNVAHKEIDIKHPKPNVGNAGFTPQERAKMTELLDSGFTDTFRHFYPDAKDAYTWWSYMANARTKNVGWRIDYFLVSRTLESQLEDAEIYADIHGSDHCPIGLKLKW